jgi:hypothetical protein
VISFLVFACPQCRHFTNAPAGQRHRRCSYCGKIIDITKAVCAVFDSPDAASAAVREFNARGDNEFQTAVERSKDRGRALMPSAVIAVEDISSKSEAPVHAGKTKMLMEMLEREARDKPCSLDHISELCREYRLEWFWVEEELSRLADSGLLVFPRPWTVQLIQSSERKTEKTPKKTDVSHEILAVLREAGGTSAVKEILSRFEARGVNQTSVEDSLDKLMQSGTIFEPRPGVVSIV